MLSVDFYNGIQVLQQWKHLRSTLTENLIDLEHLTSVVQFWSRCPLSKRTLDWDRPDLWADPWKLIHENRFDECAISLGMFYTLFLSADGRWNTERLKLMLLKNPDQQFQGVVLQIDDRYILNYDYNTVYEKSRLNRGVIVQRTYTYDNKVFSYPNLDNITAYADINLTTVN
jgi:hypothetical protein